AKALAGAALSPVVIDDVHLPSPPFNSSAIAFTLKPVEAAGPVSPGLMVGGAGNVGLALFKVTDPLAQLGQPVITPSFIDTPDITDFAGGPQMGSSMELDSGDTRLQKTVLRD